jgi:hypothetical protein
MVSYIICLINKQVRAHQLRSTMKWILEAVKCQAQTNTVYTGVETQQYKFDEEHRSGNLKKILKPLNI